MQHRRPTPLTTLAALMLLALLLAGCGGQSAAPAGTVAEAPAAPALDRSDPLAVHTAWVQALDTGDVDAAAELVASGSADERRWFVQDKLGGMQQLKQGKQQWAGAFRSLEVLSVREESGARWAIAAGPSRRPRSATTTGYGWLTAYGA